MQLLRWQTPDDLAQLDLRLLDDALRRLVLLLHARITHNLLLGRLVRANVAVSKVTLAGLVVHLNGSLLDVSSD